MTGKKSQSLLYGVAGGLIAAIIVSIFVNLGRGEFDVIGMSSLKLIGVSNDAESALFYIDQSAKYALQQAVYDLASNGGYYDAECGYFGDSNVWAAIEKINGKSKIKKCYPSDDALKKGFAKFFDESLNSYLASYPNAYLPGSYNYELSGNLEITGKSTENLIIVIAPENFVFKPEIKTEKPNEVFQQVLSEKVPEKLNAPMKSNPDIETIKQYHPEVWTQYVELCKRMGGSPGICKYKPTQCCVTSGYRHPFYNKEIGGAGNSPHQYGVALDIYTGKGAEQQLKAAKLAEGLFTRVGIYPTDTHIHVDLMPLKEEYQTAFWIGKGGTTLAKATTIQELENKANVIT